MNLAIVANLPYNVGTNLFTGWLSGAQWPPRWTSLTLMFQLEVAERIVATPDPMPSGVWPCCRNGAPRPKSRSRSIAAPSPRRPR
jgi:hypothetical protein